jgi:hypothetical protein
MKGRCIISFIGPVRNGMPLISRGFHGGRRADVDASLTDQSGPGSKSARDGHRIGERTTAPVAALIAE